MKLVYFKSLVPTKAKLGFGTAISLIIFMVAISNAQASLIGDSVRAELSGGSLSLDQTAVVADPGIEFSLVIGSATLSLDVKSDSFDIIHDIGSFPAVVATSWTLSDLDWGISSGIVTDVTLASGDGSVITGISFTDDSITIDIDNYFVPPQNQIEIWSFDITASHAVSEPSTIAMLGAGIAIGFGAAFRRKRVQKVVQNG